MLVKSSKWIAVFACLALTSASLRAAEKDIVATAVGAGSFNTLVTAVKAADLVETLQGPGPFTVFAPSDEAFAKLPEGTVADLVKPEQKGALTSILTYHVVAGKVKAADVVKLSGAKSVNGQQIDIAVKEGKVYVDNAQVVATDIECTNGVIHVIDTVILPATDNLAATAQKAGKFNTLVAAAKAAGLVPALTGNDDLTVFAPTDEAFAKLPEGTVENLLKQENLDQLATILKYHVVAGRVYAADALQAGTAKTLAGQSISIKVNGSQPMVNDAKIVATDIDASNGVIHVIDSVILPPAAGTSSVPPAQMIEHAIARGSHLYNAGHAAECAAVYSDTIETLLTSHGQTMCPVTAKMMSTKLTEARHTSCQDTRAWTLRRVLDTAYTSLSK